MSMNMNNLLGCRLILVDDEPELLNLEKTILTEAGFSQIIGAASCSEARATFLSQPPDAAVLDVMLPDGSGFTLFQELRAIHPQLPVLFLSARDEDETRLAGLGLGADDYITKPFLPQELVLRLMAILRRAYAHSESRDIFQLGDTRVDLAGGTAVSSLQQSSFTATELALLKKLAENDGKIVTTDALCRAAWEGELWGYENTLMVHIHRIREKIEPDPSKPCYLKTVRGLGYKFVSSGQP